MSRPVFAGTLTASFLLSLAFASAGSAEPVSRGAMLANSCAGCHGPGGHSAGAIPGIAGKSPEFIQRAFTEFRAGTRPATVMDRHAKGYTDEEIRLIAEFFAQQ